jgi:hypothetical protein
VSGDEIEAPEATEPIPFDTRIANRSREDLTSRGIRVDDLEAKVRASRDALPEIKRRLDEDVARIFQLRKDGKRDQADALAERVRDQRAAMEQGFRETVAIERLLEGDDRFLNEDEQAEQFEGRRQGRIDMLETNLPLLRQEFTPAVDEGREADRAVLDSYGLTDLSSQDPAEVDRRTRGVGLPRSQAEFAQSQLDRLNQFDVEGFVNRPITSTQFEGRDELITRLQGAQRQESTERPDRSPIPDPADVAGRVAQNPNLTEGQAVAAGEALVGDKGKRLLKAVESGNLDKFEDEFRNIRQATTNMSLAEKLEYGRALEQRAKELGGDLRSGADTDFGSIVKDEPGMVLGATMDIMPNLIKDLWRASGVDDVMQENLGFGVDDVPTPSDALEFFGLARSPEVRVADERGISGQLSTVLPGQDTRERDDNFTRDLILSGELSLDNLTPEDRRRILSKFPQLAGS